MSTSTSPTVREAAQSYIGRGWKPIPVGYMSKRPTQFRWQRRGVTEGLLDVIFPRGKPLKVGVILGAASGGLTDVDLDCAEAIALAAIVLPHTGAIFGRESKPRSHFLYRTELAATSGKATHKFTDPYDQAPLLEVRIGSGADGGHGGGPGGSDAGAQTVFPGSMHESGEAITWAEDRDPSDVDGDVLLDRARLLASLCVMMRYWPATGAGLEAHRVD